MFTHLTSKPPTMMYELRKLYLLIDSYDVEIKTQYIRSPTHGWAYNLSRIADNSDRRMAPKKSDNFDKRWDPHTIYCFASFANK